MAKEQSSSEKMSDAAEDLGGAAKDQAGKAADGAEEVADSKSFEIAARVGYAANGLMHLVIGLIAITIAAGETGNADQSGAVAALAAQPGGYILLWVSFLGCLMLALFKLSETAFAWKHLEKKKRWLKRAKSFGQGIAYAAVGTSFGSYAMGGGSDSGTSAQDVSSALMANPVGIALLFALGLGIIAIGGYYGFKGATQRFRKDLQKTPRDPWRSVVYVLGSVGYVSKGVALAVLGVLLIVATAKHNPEESTGLDGALKSLQEQPFGNLVLGAIALGLISYGLYSMVRAPLDKM